MGIWLDASVEPIPLAGGSASPIPLQMAGIVLAAIGVAIVVWGAATFLRARTPIVPMHPATSMVTHGPYRFTRNPMYLGSTLAYVGLALALNTAWPLLLLPIVLVALFTFVIRREEQHLSDMFGAEYAAYKNRVRRWL